MHWNVSDWALNPLELFIRIRGNMFVCQKKSRKIKLELIYKEKGEIKKNISMQILCA